MIIYNENKQLGISFNSPDEAINEISNLINLLISHTANTYLKNEDSKQGFKNAIIERITE